MDLNHESLDEIDSAREKENVKKLEAALFIAGRFMTVQELVALTDINPLLLKKLLEDLQDAYANKGISIIRQNEMWKMDVSPEYTTLVNKLATGSSEFTKAEQESLAIIAYKQPIKQSILIKIRGNKAYDHVKKFVSMGLIIKKRMGHTSEIKLSDTFHEYFHSPEQGEK